MSGKPIKVLVVDDSALVRKILTLMLQHDPAIEVVGAAPDPYIAREKIKELEPDVITLDVEMPRMDGLTFLRNLMRLRPMPVIMVSSLTERGADVTLEALSLGVVDFITKPKGDLGNQLQALGEELCAKVKAAAHARIRGPVPQQKLSADAVLPRRPHKHLATTDSLIAIGASTGGTEAIKEVLLGMPPDAPGIVITQHIPPGFSRAFAERMDKMTRLRVKEAEDGDAVIQGHAFVAPGDKHLLVERSGGRYVCRLSDGPPVNRHKPSVDVLFRSIAHSAGPRATAAILTGMGADGAQGLLELHEAGAHTVAQDEATCVVWGMPGEAVKLGAADEVLPLAKVAAALLAAPATRGTARAKAAAGTGR
ncbi:chemotaxis response regulator protein-glutamate methylesterase [Thioalkalivibrio sp. XN279]|uniref:protein-glutamate methylesterase/protein-glutamine glutaminase n=1 Tax=Thioalkalivibrio sp. XN279 TaxID=2714953 RepID=UPI0014095E9A|nr:chemotaxis response regulator protein-glutamate methylesterase [Thioalkalivibrio sp. XN279]NHA15663.1 chemotaxis response regulator protein-glutamate methylesterase [Thioalkalivibrio sp. XN279]